ncbi:BTAD domain-containing putative transcriptional regulator [Streptomyces niveiscabiei]|uniref:BTAD domain-containing putative transcriptional regulator n=1 Tax=Streptomyces niveiscabiei TaxID=164115 RepID=UPI0029A2D30D|nr:BTAD domain-containing putative transcriptional regulator [Streptomyces niveiscabiei]MDX3382055.1 BTAD domain-containing putative transcriptional regulator [Streptomyces niveiscabiei]
MTVCLSFQVLGPLKVRVDGRPLLLRSARQRTVLAVLLLTPGRAVSVDALADAVWHGRPPVTARNQIAICVSALRKTFRDEAGVDGLIETQLPGYVLHREGHYVDVADLYESAAAARAAAEAGKVDEAAARFEDALALWSGPVLDGMDDSVLSGVVDRITELRTNLTEEYAAVQLRRGRYRSVVESLGPLVAEHPLREDARAVLMRAYHLSGRRSEALDCYREGRRILVAELGVEPGAELRELHRTVLEGDARAQPHTPSVPAQRRPDTARPHDEPGPPGTPAGIPLPHGLTAPEPARPHRETDLRDTPEPAPTHEEPALWYGLANRAPSRPREEPGTPAPPPEETAAPLAGESDATRLGYRALSPQAARLYRQVSMLDVPDVPEWIGCPVLGVTPDTSGRLLNRLVAAGLLEVRATRAGTTRFRLPGEARRFARDRCLAEDTPQDREQTLDRVLTAVLTLVHTAQEQLYGKGAGPAPAEPVLGDTAGELVADPIEWFEDERETLGALVAQAVREGRTERAWHLVAGAVPFYETRNYLDDWRRTAELALDGARRTGDTRGAGTMLRSLGTLAIYQRRHQEARDLLRTALDHLEDTDDIQGRAIVRRNLAVCARFLGDLAEAARCCEESLVLFRRAEDNSGLSHALGLLAQIEIEQGNPERGVSLSNQAIEVSYEAGSLRSRTQNLYRLAEGLLGAGRCAQAERICHDVVGLARGQGDRLGEAHGLCALGEAQWRQDEPCKARAGLLRALRLAQEVGDRFLQARIVVHLACAEAVRGGPGAGEPLDWAQREFRTLGAPAWERRAGRLREVLGAQDASRPVEGSLLAGLLADR